MHWSTCEFGSPIDCSIESDEKKDLFLVLQDLQELCKQFEDMICDAKIFSGRSHYALTQDSYTLTRRWLSGKEIGFFQITKEYYKVSVENYAEHVGHLSERFYGYSHIGPDTEANGRLLVKALFNKSKRTQGEYDGRMKYKNT